MAVIAPHIPFFDVESYVVNKGREFIHAVNDNPDLLGYELSTPSKESLADSIRTNWAGAFVHVLSYDENCRRDMNAFTLCRKAWLKFIVDANDEISL